MTFLSTLIAATDQGVVAAGGSTTPAGRRLAEMRDFYAFVQGEMPEIMEKWRANKQ